MANQTLTNEGYYRGSQTFLGKTGVKVFTLSTANFDPLPAEIGEFSVYINNTIQIAGTYTYTAATGVVEFVTAPAAGATISVELGDADREYGSYQYIKLNDIVNNFLISYVGEEKIIAKTGRTDVAFHAQRAIQELNYDTLRSTKSQEIEIPPSLLMALPHDYVNYTKVCWVDDNGLEVFLHPAKYTSNPKGILQDSDYRYIFDSQGRVTEASDSETWKKYKDGNKNESEDDKHTIDSLAKDNMGGRYGMDPTLAQTNGTFFIDPNGGRIHFSSNVAGKIVTLHYISDGLAEDGDMIIHKFAEEAVYKYIAHGILSTRMGVPEYVINRFKRERFAEIRKAKIRLSNLKSQELAQTMRGKSKTIKH